MRGTEVERGRLPRAARTDGLLARALPASGPGRLVADVAIGGVLPLLTSALIVQADDTTRFRPAAVLLAVVVGTAGLVGFRAGLVATVVGAVCVWAEFTEEPRALTVSNAISVAVFVLAAAGVLALVARLDHARARAEVEKRVADALIDGAPVGIGLLDDRLRFERVNPRLAAMDGADPDKHLGRRPEEVGGVTEVLHQGALDEVLRTGRPLLDHPVSVEDPREGTELHWRANFYPVRDPEGALVGVGTTVEDVTGDVVGRRRVAQLLRLAQQLAEVIDEDALITTVEHFLGEAFAARCAMGLVDRDGLRLRGPGHGYPPEVVELWTAGPIPLPMPGLMGEAIERRAVATVSSAAEFANRWPEVAATQAALGEETLVCAPLLDPDTGDAMGVLRVGWTYRRPITDTSVTFCETVASLCSLALRRIQLASALERDRFRAGMNAMMDDVAIGTAVRDQAGRIVDFVLDFVSESSVDGAGRTARELEGRRVLDLYPAWRSSGQYDRFREVVETRTPYSVERLPYVDELPDGTPIEGYWRVQVVPLGDGYMAASRDVTEVVRLEEAERESRRLAEREEVAVQLLQRAALPARLPRVPDADIGATYQPAGTEQPVGGDWYDAFPLGDGAVGLVIADVAGHGPDAAAFMLQVRNVLRALAVGGHRPDEVLRRANAVVTLLDEPGSPFVTCCYGVLDHHGRRFRWSSAGHPPPLLVQQGVAAFPEHRGGLPLAVTDDAAYPVSEVSLAPGDRIVLYTDGLVERRGEVLDEGLERLRGLVAGCRAADAQSAADALGSSVEAPFDDLAVVVVDIRDAPADPP